MARKLVASLLTTACLLAGLTTPAEAVAPGIQAEVNAILADGPGGRQISPDTVQYDGYTVTARTVGAKLAACRYGHLCVYTPSRTFDYYQCDIYPVTGYTGNGSYVNNQTSGTMTTFLRSNYSIYIASIAYSSGNANWDPVYYVNVCPRS
ncbi:hypothetical protein OG474_08710 [Kribbella sp. NBC_01505]|uniref:hypothetical protein n=1 Tax=Kribbella sp. NBC_01505 TaxID=2903580 RepID=UPI00386FA972